MTLATPTPLARTRGVVHGRRHRHWLRPLAVTTALAAIIASALALGTVQASRLLDEAMIDAVREDGSLVVRVGMDFVPEPFHMAFFQQVGSLRGVDGTEVCVRIRSEQALRDIARQLWVASIGTCER